MVSAIAHAGLFRSRPRGGRLPDVIRLSGGSSTQINPIAGLRIRREQPPMECPEMSSVKRNTAWDLIIRVDSDFDYSKCALLVIDLQYLTASREHGAFKKVTDGGFGEEGEYAISRIENTVVPNVVRLAREMRARNLPVIFARVGSILGDGSDQTERHRRQGLTVALHERPAQILDTLGVEDGDLVITKSGSGCFTSTNLDHMLRNMGIRDLILTGMWTNSCVETTARNAGDLDYRAVIVEDCCVAMTENLHAHALQYMDNNWGAVKSTDEVIAQLGAVKPADRNPAGH